MNFNLLTILNANVYLTNILTIPIIILTYLISKDIKDWKRKDKYNETTWNLNHFYEYLWDAYFWIVLVAFILSNLYHLNMFNKFSIWKQIGKLDAQVSAPLTFVIMVFLIIMYYVYLHNTNTKQSEESDRLKQATIPIYRLGIFFIVIGGISYIVKRSIYKYNYYDAIKVLNNPKDQALWTSGHIFFHYMCYTGGLLIVLLYYIDNKNIYRTINEKIKNDKNNDVN
jgi:hypothetical protein